MLDTSSRWSCRCAPLDLISDVHSRKSSATSSGSTLVRNHASLHCGFLTALPFVSGAAFFRLASSLLLKTLEKNGILPNYGVESVGPLGSLSLVIKCRRRPAAWKDGDSVLSIYRHPRDRSPSEGGRDWWCVREERDRTLLAQRKRAYAALFQGFGRPKSMIGSSWRCCDLI